MTDCMCVIKRDGRREAVNFNKITARLRGLAKGLHVDCTRVTQKVVESVFDGIVTRQLDELAARIAASMALDHPDYNELAGRVAVSNHQKGTHPSFYRTMKILHDAVDVNGDPHPIVSKELMDFVRAHRREIEDAIVWERDYLYDFFGWKTLEKGYLTRLGTTGEIVERIQHMWMRVACGLHLDDLAAALQTYDMMSRKLFTHATPTLFNMGTPRPQGSSCFLISMQSDSVKGIFSTLEQCALVSKFAGGIGMHIHDVRAKNSYIRGTNGRSSGIVPMLKVFNATARYVDQCFVGETGVLTSRGLRRIAELQPGDVVVGADGAPATVRRVLSHRYDDTVLRLTLGGNGPTRLTVEATPDHRVLAARSYKPGTLAAPAEYRRFGDLLVGDTLATPTATGAFVDDFLCVDDCFVLGLLVASGVGTEDTASFPHFASAPPDVAAAVREYLETRGIVAAEDGDAITWCLDMRHSPITCKMFMAGVAPFLHGLSHDKTAALLDGLERGRGWTGARDSLDGVIHALRLRAGRTTTVDAIETVDYAGRVYDLELESGANGFVFDGGVAHAA